MQLLRIGLAIETIPCKMSDQRLFSQFPTYQVVSFAHVPVM